MYVLHIWVTPVAYRVPRVVDSVGYTSAFYSTLNTQHRVVSCLVHLLMGFWDIGGVHSGPRDTQDGT